VVRRGTRGIDPLRVAATVAQRPETALRDLLEHDDRGRLVPLVKGQPVIVPDAPPAPIKPKAKGPETDRAASMSRREIVHPLVAARVDCRRVANRLSAPKVVRRDRVLLGRERK
jgi:hypothetical protein